MEQRFYYNAGKWGFLESTDFEFDGIEFLLFEMVSQHVPVTSFLLHGKLPESEALHPAVTWWHPKGAATLRGHTGEALPTAEVVDCHALKVHVSTPQSLWLLLESGWDWDMEVGNIFSERQYAP